MTVRHETYRDAASARVAPSIAAYGGYIDTHDMAATVRDITTDLCHWLAAHDEYMGLDDITGNVRIAVDTFEHEWQEDHAR